jgi:hypothetical protein
MVVVAQDYDMQDGVMSLEEAGWHIIKLFHIGLSVPTLNPIFGFAAHPRNWISSLTAESSGESSSVSALLTAASNS